MGAGMGERGCVSNMRNTSAFAFFRPSSKSRSNRELENPERGVRVPTGELTRTSQCLAIAHRGGASTTNNLGRNKLVTLWKAREKNIIE